MNKVSLLVLVAFSMLMASCQDDDFAPAKYEYVGLNARRLPTSFFEGTGAAGVQTVNVPVYYGGELENTRGAIEVTLRVDEANTTAVLGEDYLINGGTSPEFTVSIPAGATEGSFTITTIPNIDLEDNRTLKIDIVGNNANLNIGYPLAASWSTVIEDDDCEYDLAADYQSASAFEDYGGGSTWGPYDVNFTVVNETTLLMDNFWDWGQPLRLTFNPNDLTFNIDPQVIIVQGGLYDVTGTGVLSPCNEQFILTPRVVAQDGSYDSGNFTLTYSF